MTISPETYDQWTPEELTHEVGRLTEEIAETETSLAHVRARLLRHSLRETFPERVWLNFVYEYQPEEQHYWLYFTEKKDDEEGQAYIVDDLDIALTFLKCQDTSRHVREGAGIVQIREVS